TLNESGGKKQAKIIKNKISPIFSESNDQYGIDFEHHENDYSDFDKEQLSFQMLSVEGPHLAKADVNGDKRDDFFVCGASGQPGSLYIQKNNGRFQKTNLTVFEKDKQSEDVDCIFFDADNDNDQDLFVCSGGSDTNPKSSDLTNRLYLNDGKGNFSKSSMPFTYPGTSESSSCVTAADFDQDGDQDLFVGVRLKISQYGIPANGYILKNDGKGNFTNATLEVAPQLINIGMITDAEWFDYDRDGDADLVVCGEYMPIKIFKNNRGKLSDATVQAGLEFSNGWWNRLIITDINNDGFEDIVAGNHGLNSRFKASKEKPISMYVSDFDDNGNLEQIICNYNGSKSFPMILRHDLVAQIPSLKKSYLKYEDYKGQTIENIFSSSELNKASVSYAYNLASSVLLNKKNGSFNVYQLPAPVQYSATYGINADDFDGDGNVDILLAGNFFQSKPEIGIYDASYGLLLKGDGKGRFTALSQQQSGISLKGQIRDILKIKTTNNSLILFGVNDDKVKIYQIKPSRIARKK
ncbi:MAG: Repeat protein, partial [Daejeonella sp.]|nr:Repeat protein [Daejeonella sp.]